MSQYKEKFVALLEELFQLNQPELDFGGKRNPDGQGFAAFGRVTEGMELIRKIHAGAAAGQQLTPPFQLQRAVQLE